MNLKSKALKVVLACLAGVIFLACLKGEDWWKIYQAKQAAASKLADPASAQFRNVRMSDSLTPIVCGEINAKNLFGAYTGFKRFFYFKSATIDPGPNATEFENIWWQMYYDNCTKKPTTKQ